MKDEDNEWRSEEKFTELISIFMISSSRSQIVQNNGLYGLRLDDSFLDIINCHYKKIIEG